jgi:hypothetical protein
LYAARYTREGIMKVLSESIDEPLLDAWAGVVFRDAQRNKHAYSVMEICGSITIPFELFVKAVLNMPKSTRELGTPLPILKFLEIGKLKSFQPVTYEEWCNLSGDKKDGNLWYRYNSKDRTCVSRWGYPLVMTMAWLAT